MKKLDRKNKEEWDKHVRDREEKRKQWKKEAESSNPTDSIQRGEVQEFSGRGSRYKEMRGNGCKRRTRKPPK